MVWYTLNCVYSGAAAPLHSTSLRRSTSLRTQLVIADLIRNPAGEGRLRPAPDEGCRSDKLVVKYTQITWYGIRLTAYIREQQVKLK
jgi:hypothetical protein